MKNSKIVAAIVSAILAGGSASAQNQRGGANDSGYESFVNTYHKVLTFLKRMNEQDL